MPRPAYPNNFNGDPYFNDALSAQYTAGGNQPPAWVISEAPVGTGWARKKLWSPGALRISATSYIVYLTGQDRPGHRCIGHATASNPWGPFTAAAQPDICTPPDGSPAGVLDPQPFRAPDGKMYLHYRSEGVPGSKPTSIYSRRLGANGLLAPGTTSTKILSTDASWQMWDPAHGTGLIENPAMVHFKGRYYLFYSGNDWQADQYGTGYAICAGPSGPCTNKSTSGPFLRSGSGYTGAGGASPFLTPDGSLILGFAAWNKPSSHAGGTRTFHTRSVYARADGSLTFTAPTPVSDPAEDARFVHAAYRDFLGREATATEAASWAAALSSGGTTRAGFIGLLSSSPEWIGASIDRLYVDTLGRPADAAGKGYWTDRVLTLGDLSLATNLGASPEYYQLAQSR